MTEPEGKRPGLLALLPVPGNRGAPLSQVAKAVLATLALLVIGGLIEPSSVSLSAINSMLPFVAVLAVAAIGQHLVIQQRGLDLSVAGIMSFAAVVVAVYPAGDAGPLATFGWVLLALLMGLTVGAINGVLVTYLRVPALVTTIGINSLMLGATMYATGGFARQVPPPLNAFGLGRFLGIPLTVYIMIAITAAAAVVLSRTAVGRRFIATSVNPGAAVAVAIRLDFYRMATYALAGFFYAAAGVLLSGYVLSPTVNCGLPYMLPTIAAVVVGGNSIGGGQRGSVVATVVGALFLTYLGQLVLSVGFGTAAQNIVQAVIIIASFAVPEIARWRRLVPSFR